MTDRNYPAYVSMILNAMGQKRGKEVIKACHEDYCPCAFNDFYPTPMDAVLYDKIMDVLGNRAPHVYATLMRNIEGAIWKNLEISSLGFRGFWVFITTNQKNLLTKPQKCDTINTEIKKRRFEK